MYYNNKLYCYYHLLARKEDVQYDIQYLYYLVAESSSRGQNQGGLFGRILIGGKKLHLYEYTTLSYTSCVYYYNNFLFRIINCVFSNRLLS